MSKHPVYPYVLVEWDDAHGDSGNTYTIDRLDHKPIRMRTRGMLLRDDEVGISLTDEDYTEQGEQIFRGHNFIPRGMVVSVTPLKTTRKPKQKKPLLPVKETEALPPS